MEVKIKFYRDYVEEKLKDLFQMNYNGVKKLKLSVHLKKTFIIIIMLMMVFRCGNGSGKERKLDLDVAMKNLEKNTTDFQEYVNKNIDPKYKINKNYTNRLREKIEEYNNFINGEFNSFHEHNKQMKMDLATKKIEDDGTVLIPKEKGVLTPFWDWLYKVQESNLITQKNMKEAEQELKALFQNVPQIKVSKSFLDSFSKIEDTKVGGSSTILRHESNSEVILKKINNQNIENNIITEVFKLNVQREFLLGLISHLFYPKHFGRTYGYFFDGRSAYIIMENHGDDLSNINYYKPDKMPNISLKLINEYLEILEDLKIQHCDIKYENMVYKVSEWPPKIIDFGNAVIKDFDTDGQYSIGKENPGTVGYMIPSFVEYTINFTKELRSKSPEFLEHIAKYNVRRDHYSLGIILIKYYTGTKDISKYYTTEVNFLEQFNNNKYNNDLIPMDQFIDQILIKNFFNKLPEAQKVYYQILIKHTLKNMKKLMKEDILEKDEKKFIQKNVINVWEEYVQQYCIYR